MGPNAEDLAGRERSALGRLAWLAIFALAFGYIEGAVAHYLRMHFYPGGFDDTISLVVDTHTLAVEVGREICTLLLMVSVTALTKGPFSRRLASFVFVFGVWDLSYYAALWVFEGWPVSLADWDLLFLVPIPWFGPVLAPMVISGIGVVGAISVHIILDRRGELVLPWRGLTLINAALVAWEISFMDHEGSRTEFPIQYRWWLFILGVALSLTGYLLTWWANRRSRVHADARRNRASVMFDERIEVECYSGHRADERPVAFTLRDRRFEVEEIVDRWHEGGLEPGRPALRCFKIRTAQGQLFLLRYDALFDAWSTTAPEALG